MAKCAIVTGGTRGIGKAISLALKKRGDDVAAIFSSNLQAAQDFEKAHGIATFQCDVSDFQSCLSVVKDIESSFGKSTDILINNAGITADSTLHKMDDSMWDRVIQTNLSSAFYMSKAVIEGMRAQKEGRIVNMSSVNALKGQFGQANYAAAKAGLIGFTKSLALETAALGITVNAVAPGYTDTDMVRAVPEAVLEKIKATIPMKRLGEARDIAALVSFITSDKAPYITGATLHVNGGLWM